MSNEQIPRGGRWLGAVEGYYGPPLHADARLALVEWLGGHGFNCFAYAPKDDPYHRSRWRELYPPDRVDELRTLVETGRRAGIDVALVVSPGLDWRDGDDEHLARKLASFRDLGAPVLGVAWDDVAPGGADLGERHGAAVAAAASRVDAEARWITCPTDYATAEPTAYLEAFVDALPAEIEVMWTGPSIVSPTVDGNAARQLGAALGRRLLFAENWPVNDGAMAGVLHLGPYPERSPDLVEATTGVFCNFMSRPLASRLGLAVAARFWLDPACDREDAWRDCLAEFPGLEPLARASRSWIADPGPDPQLESWARAALDGDPAMTALRAYLIGNCRAGLDPELAAEIEPWLDQWEKESQAMQLALELLSRRPERPANIAFVVAALWGRARVAEEQLFGIRWAHYPVTRGAGPTLEARAEGLVAGENLTDHLCRLALTGVD